MLRSNTRPSEVKTSPLGHKGLEISNNLSNIREIDSAKGTFWAKFWLNMVYADPKMKKASDINSKHKKNSFIPFDYSSFIPSQSCPGVSCRPCLSPRHAALHKQYIV
jgi:hypothetical protein